MVLISTTHDFRERTKSKLVKIMIWASIVVFTFLPWIWEVSLSRYWDRLIDFLDRYLWATIEVGINLSLLSNLFWILKTTLAVGYRLLFVLYYLLLGSILQSESEDIFAGLQPHTGGKSQCLLFSKPKEPKEVHMMTQPAQVTHFPFLA
ncbi:hypothetical protein ACJX0J_026852 [Zea mays]